MESKDWNDLNIHYLNEADNTLALIREQKNKSVGPLPDDSKIYRSLREYLNSSGEVSINDPYEKSVWVFASINAKLQNISRVPLCLYTDGLNNTKKLIETGDLYNLLLNPNRFMTQGDLIRSTIGFLELYGESFWIIERSNITQTPKEIYCFNPNRFEPMLNKNNAWTGGWLYNPPGNKNEDNKIPYAPWEVIQFKYFNPYDSIRGLSPINASRLGVEQDYFASLYNKNFFKDGASIGGMISVPESLTQEQFDRILGQFNERHQGYNRSHRIALIEGDAKFTSSNMSQRDMEFISLKDVTRREILAAFKTNEVILGDYGQIQSFEGIKQAHKSFWEETLLPIMLMIENILWARFFSKLSETKGKVWASFDTSSVESLREDYELKTNMAKTLADIGFPLNEINKKLDLGFPELSWGNTWFVRVGMVPVESILNGDINNSENNEEKKPKEEPKEDNEEDSEKDKDKEEEKDIINLSNREDALWSRFIAKQIPIENIAINKLKKIFYEQRKKILQNISYKKKDILDFFNEEEKELKKTLTLIYNMSSNIGLELLNEEVISDSLIDSNEEITKLINNRLDYIPINIINTIKNNLIKIIENSYDNNSIQENLIEEIKKYYNKLSNRIKNMAKTEVNSIINGTRYIHMKNIGVTHSKWISKSEIGRESHKSINGKIVKLGDSFSDKFIMKYPTDPKAPLNEIIGCSCITIPIINIK